MGDIYFSSTMVNEICKSNPELLFFYYTINGSIFFEGISNLKRLHNLELEYKSPIINGQPPEQLIDRKLYDVLLHYKLTDAVKLNYNGKEILFVNVWCMSPFLLHNEFLFNSAINSYNTMIKTLNKKYNMVLKFALPSPCDILDFINKVNYRKIAVNTEDLKETIFVFNYKPRSVNKFNMYNVYKYVIETSKTNKIIVACHNPIYDNNENITFIDKTYGIYPSPSAENLLQLWDIAAECKKIIILPSGSSWTFFHKLNKLEKGKLFMFNNADFNNILNDDIKFLTGKNTDIISTLHY